MKSEGPIPVAEYVRMSTEDQKYSIPNQQDAIRQYAAMHGFCVCRTYADPGRSGVLIKHREGLSHLLQDVVSGNANYKAILVYDVSRWGRFQNPDEAAHYDFICTNAGIPVHYCAEQFSNDGSMQSSLMKAIKRTMAGEFSRELGVKVFDGLKRLVLDGFHAGAVPPYGLDRMLISASGQKKGVLRIGEIKNLKTDKVVLVRGNRQEIRLIRRIFSMCADERKNSGQIARRLNSEGFTYRGQPWTSDRVLRVLRTPHYLGLNVWARRSQKGHGPSTRKPKELWVTSKARFRPIIDQAMFDRAQKALTRHRITYASPDALLNGLKQVLKRNGRLTCDIIDRSRVSYGSGIYIRRFGSMLRAYELVGCKTRRGLWTVSEHIHRSKSLYKSILLSLQELFPDEVRVTRYARWQKQFMEVDGRYRVSVVVCAKHSHGAKGQAPWLLRTSAVDRQNIILICTLDSNWRALGYYLLPPLLDSVTPSYSFYENDSWFTQTARELKALSYFCEVVRNLGGGSTACPESRVAIPVDAG